MSFAELGFPTAILNELKNQGFTEPYPIQSQAIPQILKGKDVLGIAKTGSGKTVSYVLPSLMKAKYNSGLQNRFIQTLILVPTRELAVQVGEVLNTFSSVLNEPVKTLSVYGGVSINPQMMQMNGVSVLVATPGRLLELVESNSIHLSKVELLVLDEADKLLNLGFKEEMTKVLALLPKKRQNILFSATLNQDLTELTNVVLHEPVVIKIESEIDSIDLIKHTAYFVSEERKGPFLRYLIKNQELKQVLIFVSSIQRADRVADKLSKNGIEAFAIHSDKSQHARSEALHKFKKGKLNVLVSTDLLARGIDIQFLPYVINYELPRSPKDYIHRIGRTGRAENPGEAIAIITEAEQAHFNVILKKMGKDVEWHETDLIDLKGF